MISNSIKIFTFKKRKQVICLVFFFCMLSFYAQPIFDSIKPKMPKHYFNTVIMVDGYNKNKNDLIDTNKLITKKLKTYSINQFNLSFYTPLYTKEDTNSLVYSNTHYLLTGNFMLFQPVFDGISTHNILRVGAGLRIIHNPGKKGIWFFDASPYLIKDVSYNTEASIRMASSIIYSHNFNTFFNLRVGVIKTFLYGNRNYIPYFGFRLGKLDKLNFSFQFPRSISINLPAFNKFNFSLYTRTQGGVYNFSNQNNLYYINNDKNFYFARREINTGFRIDVKPSHNFLFFISGGLSTGNYIAFYSKTKNETNKLRSYKFYFYENKLPATLFVNAGFVIKLGKSKSVYNNINLLDAIDLNNQNDVGDGNNFNGNINLPQKPEKNYNLKSIQDLIDINDY